MWRPFSYSVLWAHHDHNITDYVMIMKTATIPVVCECVCVCVCVCVFCDYSSAHILLADAADKAACCEERSCR